MRCGSYISHCDRGEGTRGWHSHCCLMRYRYCGKVDRNYETESYFKGRQYENKITRVFNCNRMDTVGQLHRGTSTILESHCQFLTVAESSGTAGD